MMSTMMSEFTVKIPLTLSAHLQAQKLAYGQTKTSRIQSIYFNSLAVYAVKYYLECAGFNVINNSADTLISHFLDVADLEVENLGKVECLYVLPDQSYTSVSEAVKFDRIAYIVVRLDESLEMAEIVGFSSVYQPELKLSKLSSTDDLIVYLNKQQPVVKLQDWLGGKFDATWQIVQGLLGGNQSQLAWHYRDEMNIEMGKIIDLGMQLEGSQVNLLVQLEAETENMAEFNLRLRVYPDRSNTYLPPGLRLIVIDEMGETLEAFARERDDAIQLELSAELGEEFIVTVGLGDALVRQKFTT